jgi:hypothetical protein
MTLRTFYRLLATVTLSLVLIGLVGFAVVFAQSPLRLLQGSSNPQPEAAVFVPRQSPILLSLLTQPDNLIDFWRVTAPATERQRLATRWGKLQAQLLGQLGLDYKRDIRPWLGEEVSFAVTTPDLDREPKNGLQPSYLLALASRDGTAAREFLQRFWQRQASVGTGLIFEQYKGAQLIAGQTTLLGRPQTELASAVVGDRFLLFANSLKGLREAINNAQVPELNLSQSPDYRQALDRLPARRLSTVFSDVDTLKDWLQNQGILAAMGQGDRPLLVDHLYGSLALSRAGIETSWTMQGDPAVFSSHSPSAGQANGALRWLPARSLLAVASHDLNQFWSQANQRLQAYPTLTAGLQALLTPFATPDLPQRVFRWMDGDYALAQLPQAGWLLAVERTPAAITGIAQLDDLAQRQGFSPTPLDLEGKTITAWAQLRSQRSRGGQLDLRAVAQGCHVALGDYELIASSVDGLTQVLRGDLTLPQSDRFRLATQNLPSPKDGIFYASWPPFQALLEQQFPALRLLSGLGRPLLEHLQALGLSSQGGEAGLWQGTVTLVLRP